MKRIHLIFIVVSAMILFACASAVSARGDDPFQYALPTPVPGFPKPGDKPLISQTKNGITVDVIDLKRSVEKRDGEYGKEVDKQVIYLDVCYSTPDVGEWTLIGKPDMLTFGGYTSQGWGMTYNHTDRIFADGRQVGKRCVRYEYKFDVGVEIVPPLTFTFDEIFASPREEKSPCEDMEERFRTNVRAQEAGLKIQCSEAPRAREGNLILPSDETVYLADFDAEKLTKQEAHALMLEIESGKIYGPWVFTIDSIREE